MPGDTTIREALAAEMPFPGAELVIRLRFLPPDILNPLQSNL